MIGGNVVATVEGDQTAVRALDDAQGGIVAHRTLAGPESRVVAEITPFAGGRHRLRLQFYSPFAARRHGNRQVETRRDACRTEPDRVCNGLLQLLEQGVQLASELGL